MTKIKRKIKNFAISVLITGFLIAVAFALATVDIRTRGIAGYMGESAITAFSNNTKNKIDKIAKEGGEKKQEIEIKIKEVIDTVKGVYSAVLFFLG